MTTDDRVRYEVDGDNRIATITLNNPTQRNSYDAPMRETLARYLDTVAEDDDITVVQQILQRGKAPCACTAAAGSRRFGGAVDDRQVVAHIALFHFGQHAAGVGGRRFCRLALRAGQAFEAAARRSV